MDALARSRRPSTSRSTRASTSCSTTSPTATPASTRSSRATRDTCVGTCRLRAATNAYIAGFTRRTHDAGGAVAAAARQHDPQQHVGPLPRQPRPVVAWPDPAGQHLRARPRRGRDRLLFGGGADGTTSAQTDGGLFYRLARRTRRTRSRSETGSQRATARPLSLTAEHDLRTSKPVRPSRGPALPPARAGSPRSTPAPSRSARRGSPRAR